MTIPLIAAKHALARTRRLALGLFVVGVVAALMANMVDVLGVVDDLEGAGTAVLEDPEGEPSSEQVETIARSAGVLLLFAAVTFLFSLGTLVFGLLIPAGLVADERRSGAIMLWAQHSMPLTGFYFRRYLGIQLANIAAQVLFGVTAALAVTPQAIVPSTDLGVFLNASLRGVLACAISFGVSALGIRRAAFVGLAYYFASSIVGGIASLDGALGSGAGGWVSTILGFVVFPDVAFDSLAAGIRSGAWDWTATGMVLYHFAGWTVVAWLGLRRISQHPLRF